METPDTPRQVLEKSSLSAGLLPGASPDQIEKFQQRLLRPLPNEIRDLLEYSTGIDLESIGKVNFMGATNSQFTEALPFTVALLPDGSGNFWVVDVNGTTGAWGTVFFVSHDPPVIVVQAPELGAFLSQLLDPVHSKPPNALNYVPRVSASQIWKNDPWLIPVRTARTVKDPVVSAFAQQLPESFRLADLRPREIGSGFSWGLAGPNAEVRRHNEDLLFAVEQKTPKFLKRVVTHTK